MATGELIYIDVIYLTLISIKGAKYAITFTDNYTKWIKVRFFRLKEIYSV